MICSSSLTFALDYSLECFFLNGSDIDSVFGPRINTVHVHHNMYITTQCSFYMYIVCTVKAHIHVHACISQHSVRSTCTFLIYLPIHHSQYLLQWVWLEPRPAVTSIAWRGRAEWEATWRTPPPAPSSVVTHNEWIQ